MSEDRSVYLLLLLDPELGADVVDAEDESVGAETETESDPDPKADAAGVSGGDGWL